MGEPILTAAKLFAIVFLVLLNGFFVAAEFAIVRVRAAKVQALARRGSRRAVMAQHLLDNLDAYLSAAQLGITIASILLGWVGESTMRHAIVEPLFGLFGVTNQTVLTVTSFLLGTGIIVFLHVVIGEQAPKYLAIRRAEATSLWIAYPMRWFYVMMRPAIEGLNRSANLFLRMFGIDTTSTHDLGHSEEELRLILAASHRSGILTLEKRNLLENVFELSTRTVRQIMVPRTEIAAFNIQKPLAVNLAIAEQTAHSRYPLTDGDLDHVIGLVHMKDLFWQLKEMEVAAVGGHDSESRNPLIAGGDLQAHPPASGADFLKVIARVMPFVPESMRIDNLLREFQQKRIHMAMVVDEYGGTSGIVTFENVIEEIVGEVQDEFDQESPRIRETGENEYVIDGVSNLGQVNDALGTNFQSEDADTLGGFLLNVLGRLPKPGDSVTVDGIEMIISEMRQQRIHRIHAKPAPPPEPDPDPGKETGPQ
jgi:CBS domain containing-hemolysin-like protein